MCFEGYQITPLSTLASDYRHGASRACARLRRARRGPRRASPRPSPGARRPEARARRPGRRPPAPRGAEPGTAAPVGTRQCRGARRAPPATTGGRREPGVSATACTRAPAPLVPLVAWLFRSRREAPVVTVKPYFAGPASAPRPNPPSRAGQRSISAAPVPSGIAGSRLVTARSLPCCRLAPIPNPSAAAARSVYAVGVRGRCARSVCAPGGKRAEAFACRRGCLITTVATLI